MAYITKFLHAIFNHPAVCDANQVMKETFTSKRREGVLSEAHNEKHVENVARCGSIMAFALAAEMSAGKLSPIDAARATALAGYYHDITRESTETKPHSQTAVDYIKSRFSDGIPYGDISDDMINVVCKAVALHEDGFAEVMDKIGMGPDDHELSLEQIVVISLKLADAAIEASGFRVIERRCAFVGRERFLKEGGDLGKRYFFPEDSVFAVTSETLRRLYGKLPIDSYPGWFKEVGEQLHSFQYIFLMSLLECQGMTEFEAAMVADEREFPKFDGILKKVESQRHLSGGYFSEEEFPKISGVISRRDSLMETLECSTDFAQASLSILMAIIMHENSEGYLKMLSTINKASNPEGMTQYLSDGILSSAEWDTDHLQGLYDNLIEGMNSFKENLGIF